MDRIMAKQHANLNTDNPDQHSESKSLRQLGNTLWNNGTGCDNLETILLLQLKL